MAMRRSLLIFCLALAVAAGVSGDALARAGFGGSFGSRGGFTFSMPPSTMTAPGGGSAFQRSWTSPNQGVLRPNAGVYGQRGGIFGGFGGGLMGGLLGAGLIGLLLGGGFAGGLSGGMSFIGLLIQLALLYFLFKFVMGLLRNRTPAAQGAPYMGSHLPGAAPSYGGRLGGSPPQVAKLAISPADYSAFEQRLGAIQKAYSDEDLNGLRAMSTPEMASWFAEDLAENARKGVVNKLSNVNLLQGDLAEAWREPNADYASVAMRFSLNDAMLDRSTGSVVTGNLSTPQQATEIWTFRRPPGGSPGDWKLSAIQQEA
jgi:predicted lipid-binding transport protein (Tim44 family)